MTRWLSNLRSFKRYLDLIASSILNLVGSIRRDLFEFSALLDESDELAIDAIRT